MRFLARWWMFGFSWACVFFSSQALICAEPCSSPLSLCVTTQMTFLSTLWAAESHHHPWVLFSFASLHCFPRKFSQQHKSSTLVLRHVCLFLLLCSSPSLSHAPSSLSLLLSGWILWLFFFFYIYAIGADVVILSRLSLFKKCMTLKNVWFLSNNCCRTHPSQREGIMFVFGRLFGRKPRVYTCLIWFADIAVNSTVHHIHRIIFRKFYKMLKDGKQLTLTMK